jgi:hypothetical protein
MKIVKAVPFHPFILFSFPAISLFLHNNAQLSLNDFLGTIAFLFSMISVIYLLTMLLVRNVHKTALLISVLGLLTFSYGHVLKSLDYFLSTAGLNQKYWFSGNSGQALLFSFYMLILILVILIVRTYRKDFLAITQFLNIVSLAIFGSLILNGIYLWVVYPKNEVGGFIDAWMSRTNKICEQGQPNQSSGMKPNIYYIILDGYGRSDVLEDLYALYPPGLAEGLHDLGFFIGKSSTANYNYTVLSLSSSLNSMYLDDIPDALGKDTRILAPLETIINYNQIGQFLGLSGYQIVALASEFTSVNIHSADIYITPDQISLNTYQAELLALTPIPVLQRWFSLKNLYDTHRDHINFTFNRIPEFAAHTEPVFVFAHILAPHPPFVFQENGSPVDPARAFSWLDGDAFAQQGSVDEYIEGYRAQAQFIGDKTVQMVREILENSAIPPIIIVQGDHGPGSKTALYDVNNTDLVERMSILNAIYFPDQNYGNLYPSITPVNTFRVILNQYFGGCLELLDDRNYFVNLDRPYDFIDVTQQVSGE